MKTILCFGDSNTWGYNAATGGRHPYDVRWTGLLQQTLSAQARVIEEGLNGRTTTFEEPFRTGRDGSALLGPLLESHSPLDLLIISLGANDFKPIYSASGYHSALGIQKLIHIARERAFAPTDASPEILVVAPVMFRPTTETVRERFAGACEKFPSYLREYARICETERVRFLDPNNKVVTSEEDGVHLDAANHLTLANSIGDALRLAFQV